jgi:hypothetical protein
MKTLILLLIFNLPSGESIELTWKRGLSFDECDRLQNEIWNSGSEIVGHDAYGPIPAVDAACIYPTQLSEPDSAPIAPTS